MNISSLKFQLTFLIVTLIIFVFMCMGSIISESRVFDEGLHVEAGYAFITKQDFAKEPFNPPLARELVALPSVVFPETLHDPIYFWQRMVTVFISCLFLICLYTFVKKLFGVIAAMFAAILYVFNPEVIAHSHYAVTDLILAFFIFLSVMLYLLWKEQFTTWRLVIHGICIAGALSTKVSGVPFLFFTFFGFLLIDIIQKKSILQCFTKRYLRQTVIVIITILITLWSTYFFTKESIMGEGFVPNNSIVNILTTIPGVRNVLSEPVPLGGYFRTIKQVLLYNYSDVYSKPAFLFGEIAKDGWWYFYPLAFIIKTPIPLILFIILGLIFLKKSSLKMLCIPIMAILISSMISTLNLGIRYILPVYPLLIVYLSQLVDNEIEFKFKNIGIIFLLAWYIAGTLTIYPHTLSYMNELSGSVKMRHHVLLDSNYDWGQGLVKLAKYQTEYSIDKMQLAYFGMVDPSVYGLKYERIGDLSLGDKKKSKELDITPGYTTAISGSCFYFCGYYKHPKFGNKKPDLIIGGSILIFNW